MTEQIIINRTEWNTLRANVYIRDKGICWVCNDFTELQEYELGHLVDKSNGGIGTYDNLVLFPVESISLSLSASTHSGDYWLK